MSEKTKMVTDDNWQDNYRDMIAKASVAVKRVRPGQRVFVGTGCAIPQTLVNALTARAGQLADVEITHLLTFGEAPYAHKKLQDKFRVNSFFIAAITTPGI